MVDLLRFSMGDSDATYEQLDEATDAGAETSAALFAADHRVADHFPGVHRATSQM